MQAIIVITSATQLQRESTLLGLMYENWIVTVSIPVSNFIADY